MADELDPVEQKFIADVEPYIEAVESAARDARDFADANLEATAAVDDMRDHAAEAGAALGDLRDHAAEAAEADHSLRDSAVEAAEAMAHERDEALAAAAAAGIYADKVGNLHEANGRFVSSARKAELGLTDIKDGLEGLRREADKVESAGGGSGRGGLLGKLLFGAFGGAGGSGSSFLGISGGGGGMLAGIAAAVPAVEALLVEAAGLASGFAAAGAGAAAFAILARPAFESVSAAYTKIKTDQLAYNNALTASAKSTALKKLKQDYASLDPAERGALRGIQHLMDAYHKMAKAFEPEAFKVFNDGLKIANKLLPDVTPFAKTFANALDGLLKKADKFAGSKGFKDWLKDFHKLEGPSVTAIGNGIGHVATAIGKLLTTMSKKDVVNAINIAFSILSGTVSFVAYSIRGLMRSWDQLSSAFRRTRHDVASAGHDIAHVFDDIRHAAADLAHNVAAHFDEIRHDVANLAHNIASYFDEARANIHRWESDVANDISRVVAYFRALPGRVLAELKRLVSDLFNLGKNIINGLLNGIKAAVGGLLGEVGKIAGDISGAFSKVLGILSPSRVFHQHGQMIIQGLIDGIRAKAPELVSVMRGLGGQTGTGFSVGGGSSAGTSPSVHVTVPVTLAGGAAGYNDPRFLQYLQGAVQEAVLRYTQVNPTNGLRLAGKLS